MSIVKIPTTHFVTSAKRQYSDIDVAIVREAVQNSVDAGARLIQIEIGTNWCRVSDDGCGMTQEILVDAMLTMSGTHKNNSGAIGGFGAAKEILLFQHEKYEIQTLDNKVVGSILEYEMTKSVPRKGTSIAMFFHESYGFNQGLFIAKARTWLSQCDAPAVITINGEEMPRLNASREVKDLGWGKLYCEDTKETTQYMTVRIKGVSMFRVWIGDVQKSIVLEITKPSTDILTSNRDGFQYEQDTEVRKLIEQITIDKSSFGRLHQTMTRITGNSRSFISRVIRQILATNLNTGTTDVVAVRTKVETIQAQVEGGSMDTDTAITHLKEMAKDIPDGWVIDRKIKDYINDVDFYIQINDKGYEKIPDAISPSKKMKKKYHSLACLWKATLKHVFYANSMTANFCIGWIIDSGAMAQYSAKNGTEMYLLNPFTINSKINKKNKKEVVHNLLITAAHEVAHRRCGYHDENFAAYSEKILLNALTTLSSYRALLADAKRETI